MAKSIDNYVTFVALDSAARRTNSSFPATFYDDNGQRKKLVLYKDDKTGEDVVYRFKFGRDKRHITFPKNKKDIYGESYVDFLREHPLNQDSPIAKGSPWFKELDSEKDAEKALDSFEIRNKAENLALSLKGDVFEEVCKVFGFEGTPKIKLHKIMEYASRNPSDFIDRVEDPNRKPTSIFRSAVESKVIKKHGFRYVYGDVHIGNDEEKAIIKIAEDKELQSVLLDAIAKAGG